MTKEDFIKEVRAYIDSEYEGLNSKAAKAWGCSSMLVSQLLNGKRIPPDSVLKAMQYRLIRTKTIINTGDTRISYTNEIYEKIEPINAA
jgi:hypothetical protein